MKKTKGYLLLSASALLAMGTLVACNKNQEESVEVDREANWPVKAWSDSEKSTIDAAFGEGIADLLPFYYVADQKLVDDRAQHWVMRVEAAGGDAVDLKNYEFKLIKAGFSPLTDNVEGEHVHYRLFVRRDSSKNRDHYLDVDVKIDSKKGWQLEFFIGEQVVDQSFSGNSKDEEQTFMEAVSAAATTYFESYGATGVKIPTAISESNHFTEIDFIDYPAYLGHYMADEFEPYTEYVNVFGSMDLGRFVSEYELDIALPYADYDAPIADFKFVSSAETEGQVEEELNIVLDAFEHEGYELSTQYNSFGEEYSYLRGNDGYEALVTVKPYDDEYGREHDNSVTKIDVYLRYEKFHDFSAKVKLPADAVSAVGACFETYNPGQGFVLPTFTQTSMEGKTFGATITDNRWSQYHSKGTDLGYASEKVALANIGEDTLDEFKQAFADAGWIFVAKDPEVTGSKDKFVLNSKFECTFSYTAAKINSETGLVTTPAKATLNIVPVTE